MKLVVNYDLINAIRNVNEPLTPLKVIRNNKVKWAKFNFPCYFAINFAGSHSVPKALGVLGFQFVWLTAAYFYNQKIFGDEYHTNSSNDLRKLVSQLDSLNIKTDYDLLLKSELYKTKYKIQLNEKKILELAQQKYILVKTYNYCGDTKDTSILQEHIVGSKNYVLSIGSPKKKYKLAYSNV